MHRGPLRQVSARQGTDYHSANLTLCPLSTTVNPTTFEPPPLLSYFSTPSLKRPAALQLHCLHCASPTNYESTSFNMQVSFISLIN